MSVSFEAIDAKTTGQVLPRTTLSFAAKLRLYADAPRHLRPFQVELGSDAVECKLIFTNCLTAEIYEMFVVSE